MSLYLKVYTKSLTDDLIPKIIERLNDYDMVIESNKDFSFNNKVSFCEFKFRMAKPQTGIVRDKVLTGGFELYIDDFNLKDGNAKPIHRINCFSKLIGKKQKRKSTFTNPELEKHLEGCKKVATFVWHSGDSFGLRFASLTSAILAELTGGFCTYPACGIWYNNKNIVDEAFKEVKEYEQILKTDNIEFEEFETIRNTCISEN